MSWSEKDWLECLDLLASFDGVPSIDEAAVDVAGSSVSADRGQSGHTSGVDEISFVLHLYPNGYSIVPPSENNNRQHAASRDGFKPLRPYDRTSADLLTAIESGLLPNGIQDEFVCKFVDGAITCEIRDYRKCTPSPGNIISAPNESATVTKVRLKLSLYDIMNDISAMADDSWTSEDYMEVESRIVNVLQPKLCLDPVPRFDTLCENQNTSQIDLGSAGLRKRRLQQTPEFAATTSSQQNGKKICTEQAPNPNCRDTRIMQEQPQNSLTTVPVINADYFPFITEIMDFPGSSSDVFISTTQVTDSNVLDIFSKIGIVVSRHKFDSKNDKADALSQRPRVFSAEGVLGSLAAADNSASDDGPRALSKSVIGGHMNVCRMRIISLPSRSQGGVLSAPFKARMILSENPDNGTVAMHYGELEDNEYLVAENNMPTLPNTHYADLLADQFCTLIIREGYTPEEVTQPRPPRLVGPSQIQTDTSGDGPKTSEINTNQCLEPIESTPSLSDMFTVDDGLSQELSFCEIDFENQPFTMQQTVQQQPRQNQRFKMQLPPKPLKRRYNKVTRLNAVESRLHIPVSNQTDNTSSQQPVQQLLHQNQPCTVLQGSNLQVSRQTVSEAPLQTVQQPPRQNQPSMMQQVQPQLQHPQATLPSNSMPQMNTSERGSKLQIFSNQMENKVQQPVQLPHRNQSLTVQQVPPQLSQPLPPNNSAPHMNMVEPGTNFPISNQTGNEMLQQTVERAPHQTQPFMTQQASPQFQVSQLMPNSTTQMNTFEPGSNLAISNQMGNEILQQTFEQAPHQTQPFMMQQVSPQFQPSQLMPNSTTQMNTFESGSNVPISNHTGNEILQQTFEQAQHQTQPFTRQQVSPQFQASQMMGNSPTQMNTFEPGSNLPISNKTGNVLQQTVEQAQHQNQPFTTQQVPSQFQPSQMTPHSTTQMNAFESRSNVPISNQMGNEAQHQNQPFMTQQIPPQFRPSQQMPHSMVQRNAFDPRPNIPVSNQMSRKTLQQQDQQPPRQNQPLVRAPQFQQSQVMSLSNSMPQLNTFEPGSNLPVNNQMVNKMFQHPTPQLQHQNQPLTIQVPPQFQQSGAKRPSNSTPQLNAREPGSNLPVSNQMVSEKQQRPILQPQFQQHQVRPTNNSTPQSNVFQPGPNSQINNQMGNNTLRHPIQQRHATMTTDIGTVMGMANYGNNSGSGRLSASGISTSTSPSYGVNGNMGLNMFGPSQARTANPEMLAAAQRLRMRQNRDMNVPLNQQQFQHRQQTQRQQQPHQLVFSQQVAVSPHQAAQRPQQVSSPSMFRIPQQMNTPYAAQQHGIRQQMAQQTPMTQPFQSEPTQVTNGGTLRASSANPSSDSEGIFDSLMDFQELN